MLIVGCFVSSEIYDEVSKWAVAVAIEILVNSEEETKTNARLGQVRAGNPKRFSEYSTASYRSATESSTS